MTRRAAAALALVAVLGASLAGCGGDDTVAVPRPEQPTVTVQPGSPSAVPQYVALGDSFSAAPGVPETSGAGGCFRSSNNYAQLIAKANDLSVVDVTCSGATTTTLLRDQVPRLSEETELVTIGIGGNDGDLFTTLVQRCTGLAASDPTGTPCTDDLEPLVESTLPTTDTSIDGVFDAIRRGAPDARVVVVGYPDLLPTTGTCPDLVPLAPGDYPLFNEVAGSLSDLLKAQAEAHDFDFVDLRGPSQGHDICSDDPWVNGSTVADDGTIPFHPFAIEQQAVARLVTAVL